MSLEQSMQMKSYFKTWAVLKLESSAFFIRVFKNKWVFHIIMKKATLNALLFLMLFFPWYNVPPSVTSSIPHPNYNNCDKKY